MHPTPSCHHLDTAPTAEKRARSATLTSRTCGSLRSRCSRRLLTLPLTLTLTLTLTRTLTVALALLALLQANAPAIDLTSLGDVLTSLMERCLTLTLTRTQP